VSHVRSEYIEAAGRCRRGRGTGHCVVKSHYPSPSQSRRKLMDISGVHGRHVYQEV